MMVFFSGFLKRIIRKWKGGVEPERRWNKWPPNRSERSRPTRESKTLQLRPPIQWKVSPTCTQPFLPSPVRPYRNKLALPNMTVIKESKTKSQVKPCLNLGWDNLITRSNRSSMCFQSIIWCLSLKNCYWYELLGSPIWSWPSLSNPAIKL